MYVDTYSIKSAHDDGQFWSRRGTRFWEVTFLKLGVLTDIVRGREVESRYMPLCQVSTGQSGTVNIDRFPFAEDKFLSKIVT